MSELMYDRGRIGVLAHKDQFNRREKDLLKADPNVEWQDPYFFFAIQEEPDDFPVLAVHDPGPDHVCDNNDDCEFHEYQGPPVVDQSDEPTMADLRGLTVAKLQELADKEEVDLTGLKLKDDILGRMALHFGLDPAE